MATQAGKKNYIVNQRKDGKWAVKKEGARCATQTLDTRETAVAAAHELADADGVEVIVQE